ncbi:MAG: hypothetical protein RPG89_15635 [Microcystis panniformis WG22]|nr:hypothetical protein [Microcystis panniformis WG22]
MGHIYQQIIWSSWQLRYCQTANTALVRTEQRLLTRVQACLPPHNFTLRVR